MAQIVKGSMLAACHVRPGSVGWATPHPASQRAGAISSQKIPAGSHEFGHVGQ
jgi:hypothetical protein